MGALPFFGGISPDKHAETRMPAYQDGSLHPVLPVCVLSGGLLRVLRPLSGGVVVKVHPDESFVGTRFLAITRAPRQPASSQGGSRG